MESEQNEGRSVSGLVAGLFCVYFIFCIFDYSVFPQIHKAINPNGEGLWIFIFAAFSNIFRIVVLGIIAEKKKRSFLWGLLGILTILGGLIVLFVQKGKINNIIPQIYCNTCKNPIDETSQFCASCGAKIEVESEPLILDTDENKGG